ncbi:FMN-dependent NADH-azoreductase [Alienimonas chondri]|uniref:FMN dependent NADH:quinone oxidoreductase n=1 Tax=Alienimonas chondri TaxID=2681879 RepID=A0ABX1VAI8_9PLAN|nr:NAD(P)H-dependent oxidoreductase [Alienimonas chondri]NNJ24960.1 FMN-dependent NADH-azoreductase 2 [Alienimonas chondri]
MARLLYVEASPRKARSHSIAVARAFLDAYRAANPADTVEELDVFTETLPAFDGDTIAAKYAVMGGEDFTPEQKSAWEAVTAAGEKFKSFDKYVFSVPMWNFGVPYALKHYIDVITQPGLLFSVDDAGNYSGLCEGPTMVISARGGEYNPSMPGGYDYQAPYMNLWCGFVGLTADSLLVQPTAAKGPEAAAEARTAAIEDAKAKAASF